MGSEPTSSAQPDVVPLVRLAPSDNVAVAARSLAAGLNVSVDPATSLTLRDAIATGHKVAIRPIASGGKVIKWGCPIGSATRDIAAGEHVHVHNLKSDYLPTFAVAGAATGEAAS